MIGGVLISACRPSQLVLLLEAPSAEVATFPSLFFYLSHPMLSHV